MRLLSRLSVLAAALALATSAAVATPAQPQPAPSPRVSLEQRPADEREAIPPPTGDPAFDAAFAQAKVNERTGDYDARLSAAFYAIPQMADLLDACHRLHEQRMPVHGYFEFPAGGGYHLVLRPATPFAACIAAAFEGQDIPEPPTRPYVHAFSFTPDADAPKP